MSFPAIFTLRRAMQLDLRRLCDCVELSGACRWLARSDCRACEGRGILPWALRRPYPPSRDELDAWSRKGALTPEEYAAVLRFERRLVELEALRRETEDGDPELLDELLDARGLP